MPPNRRPRTSPSLRASAGGSPAARPRWTKGNSSAASSSFTAAGEAITQRVPACSQAVVIPTNSSAPRTVERPSSQDDKQHYGRHPWQLVDVVAEPWTASEFDTREQWVIGRVAPVCRDVQYIHRASDLAHFGRDAINRDLRGCLPTPRPTGVPPRWRAEPQARSRSRLCRGLWHGRPMPTSVSRIARPSSGRPRSAGNRLHGTPARAPAGTITSRPRPSLSATGSEQGCGQGGQPILQTRPHCGRDRRRKFGRPHVEIRAQRGQQRQGVIRWSKRDDVGLVVDSERKRGELPARQHDREQRITTQSALHLAQRRRLSGSARPKAHTKPAAECSSFSVFSIGTRLLKLPQASPGPRWPLRRERRAPASRAKPTLAPARTTRRQPPAAHRRRRVRDRTPPVGGPGRPTNSGDPGSRRPTTTHEGRPRPERRCLKARARLPRAPASLARTN